MGVPRCALIVLTLNSSVGGGWTLVVKVNNGDARNFHSKNGNTTPLEVPPSSCFFSAPDRPALWRLRPLQLGCAEGEHATSLLSYCTCSDECLLCLL